MKAAESGSLPLRERILRAAPAVIERFTVNKFSMDDVARATGIARQTIYKHFRNRDALLIEIYVRQIMDVHAPAMAGIAKRKPSADNLVKLFMAELRAAQAFPLFDQTLDPSVAPFMAELCLRSPELIAAHESVWVPILEHYRSSGVCRAELNAAAAVRWITYQQFWLLTHPTALARNAAETTMYVRDFIVPALAV